MEYKRILTIQDISCVGQCSLTVALPILSACGMETCVLPSVVLSTHTGGFGKPAVRDLTEDISGIVRHWSEQDIRFDVVYTGYLGTWKQVELVKEKLPLLLAPEGKLVVDPAMADHGRLYSGLDGDYKRSMEQLCAMADVMIPNVTEACMMTGAEYVPDPDEETVRQLLQSLHLKSGKSVVLTGVSPLPGQTGVAVCEDGRIHFHAHRKLEKNCHGTGDIFASAMTGLWAGGEKLPDAAALAADFTMACIENTCRKPAHWYGVKFETVLPWLMERIGERQSRRK